MTDTAQTYFDPGREFKAAGDLEIARQQRLQAAEPAQAAVCYSQSGCDALLEFAAGRRVSTVRH